MAFLLFSAAVGKRFRNEDGGLESIGDHLEGLATKGGVPDCEMTINTTDRKEALRVAEAQNQHLYVVSDDKHFIVGMVNEPVRLAG